MKKIELAKAKPFNETVAKKGIREEAPKLARASLASNRDPHTALAALTVYREAK